MARTNLATRGSTYWWRRKVSVGGHAIPIALSLQTGNFHQARIMAERLAVSLEVLRMAYGEVGFAVPPSTLKAIFADAMRWQLSRILTDQIGSNTPSEQHRQINSIWGEMWRIFARDWPNPQFTIDDDNRLETEGWSSEARRRLKVLCKQHFGKTAITKDQIEAYVAKFEFKPTSNNLDRVKRVIFDARHHACKAASAELDRKVSDDYGMAVASAKSMDPYVFDTLAGSPRQTGTSAGDEAGPPKPATATVQQDAVAAGATDKSATTPPPQVAEPAESVPALRKRLLTDAMADAIAEYRSAGAWSTDTVEQVKAAIKLFDFAAGGGAMIEDLRQQHVTAFLQLCRDLPNRWGRTKAEQAGGLAASLVRAKTLDESMLGMSQTTINKHITWITQVLNHADNPDADRAHRPQEVLSFKKARLGVGKKKRSDTKRARDLRANWTASEIQRLLSAPIWTGCANLDERFVPGSEVYHDAWYWLTLMLPLYGGRSSELVGLPITDVHENADIPYFRIDYSDLRALKNVQSVRNLPIHPELLRLGFVSYATAMRKAGHSVLFPELHSQQSTSFSSTFYKSIFIPWRKWSFPDGTDWKHQNRGITKDKDVHSFRGAAASLMKGKVPDSVRFDILGHEGGNTTMTNYDDEADLATKLAALEFLSSLTSHIPSRPLRLRPSSRQKFGAMRGRKRGLS